MAEWPHGGSLFPSNSHLGVSLSIPGLLRCSLWDIGWYIEIYRGLFLTGGLVVMGCNGDEDMPIRPPCGTPFPEVVVDTCEVFVSVLI